jgi:hypothetical protein
MSQWWTVPMLISGGLFAGGVLWISWERVPAWRAADLVAFRATFAHTLRRADRLQPALLAANLVATVGVAASTSGAARTLATLAAGGALIVLVGSATWLVPIQRRLVAPGPQPAAADIERLRAQWLRGHLARTAVALALLLLAVAAAVV